MSVCSLGFLALCITVVIAWPLAPGKVPRQLLLAAASGTFLFSLVPNLRSWLFFAVVMIATYLGFVSVRAFRRGGVLAAVIGLTLLGYLYVKRYEFFATWVPVPSDWNLSLHPVELVGLSYMLFKLIHLFVDEWQGQLAPISFWSYLNYQLSFFTLTAGPIQRYNDFRQNWETVGRRSEDSRDVLLLWSRLLTGMIKIGVLGDWAYAAFQRAAPVDGPHSLAAALVCFYVYPAYLYLNFSGYTDVMIGAGGLLGFQLPENFNRPYLARNVLDFWDRWHISVTHWIRDYVFMTSYKLAASRFPSAARYWSYALLFLALFLAGVWHGTTESFVLFGALNGLGVAATRAYGDGLRARLGGVGLKAYLQNRTIRWVATLFTLHYVGFCFLFFSLSMPQLRTLFSMLSREVWHWPASWSGWQMADAAWLVLGIVALLSLWKADAIGSALGKLAAKAQQRPRLMYSMLCAQTAFVVLVLYFDWAFQQEAPPVLYMKF
ncbi:MAG TPA: MBOAT family O-acyltransferase [Planctomycetaceae bacterium]|jgi:D-alanyl-lipoteichoic acid acyltransferase DltB (MBOAT superfamily)|nr:MBOAT family O-acyltransferase [Planctomycetaceae bacterium]